MVDIKDVIRIFKKCIKSEIELLIFKYNLGMLEYHKKRMYRHSEICNGIVEEWEKQW